MEMTMWILNGTFLLLVAFGGYIAKGMKDEISHTRNKISTLFTMITDLRIQNEKSKTDNTLEYVRRSDFNEFKTEIFKRFDKSDETLSEFLTEMRKQERERK